MFRSWISHSVRPVPFLAISCLLAFISSASACNIPVFRYALENWQPDPYQAVVLHDEPLDANQLACFQRLQKAGLDPTNPANLVANSITPVQLQSDTSDTNQRMEMDPRLLAYLKSQFDAAEIDQPKILLFYPLRDTEPQIAWAGNLDQDSVSHLLHSAARQEIAKRILAGETAVWVFIKSGDPSKDEPRLALLRKELDRLQSEIELPDQETLEAEEEYRADNPIELKVAFSVIELSTEQAEEIPFIMTLLRSEPDLAGFEQPVAMPIFARGRTYYALVGDGINPETIEQNCRFMCGACSCQVKQQNPGVDVLMSVDWQSQIVGSAMVEKPLPELTGIGLFEIDKLASQSTDDGDLALTSTEPKTASNSNQFNSNAVDASESPMSDEDAVSVISEATEDAAHGSASHTSTTESSYEGSLGNYLVGGLLLSALVILGTTVWLKTLDR
ncbi:MAG: hypothetical protein KDA87_13575 [Planctomycetales bacterium]|nr:hypothetical protein [Planctomycetales bacterium]